MPFLFAIDNIAIVLNLAGYSNEAARERAQELLNYLEVGNRANAYPSSLSGGEAQCVAIAVVTHDEKIYDRLDHIFQLRDGVLDKEQVTTQVV